MVVSGGCDEPTVRSLPCGPPECSRTLVVRTRPGVVSCSERRSRQLRASHAHGGAVRENVQTPDGQMAPDPGEIDLLRRQRAKESEQLHLHARAGAGAWIYQ